MNKKIVSSALVAIFALSLSTSCAYFQKKEVTNNSPVAESSAVKKEEECAGKKCKGKKCSKKAKAEVKAETKSEAKK